MGLKCGTHIWRLNEDFPHFHEHQAITICLIFPCLKTTLRLSNTFSLSSNINLYNQQLIKLSTEMNFNIIDFKIPMNHLAYDNIHVYYRFHHFIFYSILDYVIRLIDLI